MTSRIPALSAAAVAIALTLAADLVPGLAWYHTWQYALVLFVALLIVVSACMGALRARNARATWLALALAGAATVGIAGLASGLLGPDTTTVIGTPGTVVPVPALGAAAFFGAADAASIAAGGGDILLRARDAAAPIAIGHAHRLRNESVISLAPRPAAFIEVWDDRGAHLTITQPTNSSFLSPVLLFREHQRVGAFDVPFDAFATPGKGRAFRALFFTPRDLANFRHAVADTKKPALIVTAADEYGSPLGIMLVPTGTTVAFAGVHLRATLGSYPALSIASAPPSWALVTGIALFVLGLGASVFPTRRAPAQVAVANV